MKLLAGLRPSEAQIRRLAFRETDPRYYREFTPITKGPIVALLLLTLVGLMAIVETPISLAIRAVRAVKEER